MTHGYDGLTPCTGLEHALQVSSAHKTGKNTCVIIVYASYATIIMGMCIALYCIAIYTALTHQIKGNQVYISHYHGNGCLIYCIFMVTGYI